MPTAPEQPPQRGTPEDPTPPDDPRVVAATSGRARLRRFLPVLAHARGYRKDYLRPDVLAALTVAAVAIPSSKAYAEPSGVVAYRFAYSVNPLQSTRTHVSSPMTHASCPGGQDMRSPGPNSSASPSSISTRIRPATT